MNESTGTATPRTTKHAYSVIEAMDSLGLSRQALYNELSSGRLRSFKLGRRRIIPADALPEWLDTMQGRAA